MTTRIANSIIFCICIGYVKGQVTISQTPNGFVEGKNGNITCTTDIDTDEIEITRIATPVLTCFSFSRSTCNYSTEYGFSFTGNTSVTLTIPRFSRDRDEGKWKCSTQNSSDTKQIEVNVPVSSVQIASNTNLSFFDGVAQTIMCKVQPKNVKPPAKIFLVVNGVMQSTPTPGQFAFTAARSDNGKSMICRAENNVGPAKSDALILDIKYKPIVSIIPSTSPYKIIEGEDLNFTCSAEANPTPSAYTVFSDGVYPSASVRELTIKQISRTYSAPFYCEVANTVGNGISTKIVVDVLYPPKIQLNTEYRVIENTTASIACNVESNPPAHTVTWNRGSSRTLKITNINRTESGVYTCTASNTMVPSGRSPVTGHDTNTTQVTVLYGPEVHVLKDAIVVIEFKSLQTSCTVGSNPPPTILWLSPDRRILSRTADLRLNSVKRTDAGNYTCQGTVVLDPTSGSDIPKTASKVTSITVLHVPENPTQLLFVNSTDTTICVEWEAGFNGGREQNFTIQYSTDNITWVDSQQIPERTNTKVQDLSSQEFSYCLGNLSPDTEYSVRLFPQNPVGRSEFIYFQPACCKPIRTQIQIPVPENQDGTVIGLAVGLCLAVLIAVLAILATIILYRRLTKVSKKSSNYATTELAHRESGYYADFRQPSDDGVKYENNGPETIGSENLYENHAASTNQAVTGDNEMKYENFVDKSAHSKSKDDKKENISPQFSPDEKNYENLPPAKNPPNIYENLKGKRKAGKNPQAT